MCALIRKERRVNFPHACQHQLSCAVAGIQAKRDDILRAALHAAWLKVAKKGKEHGLWLRHVIALDGKHDDDSIPFLLELRAYPGIDGEFFPGTDNVAVSSPSDTLPGGRCAMSSQNAIVVSS